MNAFLKNKAAGFYLLPVALVLAAIAAVSYAMWGTAHYALNAIAMGAMAAGILVNLLLLFVDSDYLLIALTALYSVGLFQMLVDNAGSFADAYQGIVMFGDPTQVGALLTMGGLILAGTLLTITASFLPRRK